MTHRVCECIGDLQGSDGEVETHWAQIDLMVSWAHYVRARLKAHARWMDLGGMKKGDLGGLRGWWRLGGHGSGVRLGKELRARLLRSREMSGLVAADLRKVTWHITQKWVSLGKLEAQGGRGVNTR